MDNSQEKEIIEKDLQRINDAIDSHNYNQMLDTHIYINGKYQVKVSEWYSGMNCSPPLTYSIYDTPNAHSTNLMRFDLMLMRAKLDSHLLGWNNATNSSPNVAVNVNNTNSVTVSASFNDIKEKVRNSSEFDASECAQIIEKINELESLLKQSDFKKSKWEKISPILKFIIDKGIELTSEILPAILTYFQK